MPGTHGDVRREPFDAVVLGRVLADPALQLSERIARRALGAELGAELRLTSRALHVHDELSGDSAGRVLTHVVRDERQCEIHARGDTRRRPHVAVLYEDAIALDLDARVAVGEAIARQPVRRRPLGIEQSRGRKEERTGTDRGDPPTAARELRHRPHEFGVAGRGERAVAADDHQRVDRAADRGERSVGDDAGTACGHDPARFRARHLDRIAAGCGEHLVRPDQVERRDPGIDDEDDAAAHGAIVRDHRSGSNDISRTISATAPESTESDRATRKP